MKGNKNSIKIYKDSFFNRLRKKEFSRLDKKKQIYLDYTGGGLYPKSLIKTHQRQLLKSVFGNPHSTNPASQLSEKKIKETRESILNFFHAEDYYCIFTPNATGALKIVGESYPFSEDSHFLLTADNHNSVNGIRDYCRSRGGGLTYCPMNEDDLTINDNILKKLLLQHKVKKYRLFAYPAQSNVSGVQHSLSWIKVAQELGWDVLLDAAAYVPTSALDLSEVHPDFVSVSFYKIFGYPTGIGCLLIKKSKFNKLKKPWYAGGTITVSAVRHTGYFLKSDYERYEDGTVNYLNISAITDGLKFISDVGMENIHQRIKSLTGLFLSQLKALIHINGSPLIRFYGPRTGKNRGGTIMLNFLDKAGHLFPFQYIEDCANAENISLRSGCFYNPGIDEINHCLSRDQVQGYFTSREHGDYFDMIRFLNKLRGAIRISIGLPTTRKDIYTFISFAEKFINLSIPEEFLDKREMISPMIQQHYETS